MESKPMYDSVSIADDHEESLSSTEVEESLMGDEKQWHSRDLERGRRAKRNTCMSTFRSYRWMIDTFLLLVIVGLLLLLRSQGKEFPTSSWQVGGDFSGAGPKFPTKIVKWEADMDYAPTNTTEFFTDATLNKWRGLMPAGTGWNGAPNQTFFTTSMTHQLHCVYMMARMWSGVMSNITQGFPEDYQSHYLHCIDYLRQAIMCSADLALEAHETSDTDDLGPLDGGWSGHHVCKDYTHVISYLEEQITDNVRVVLPIDD